MQEKLAQLYSNIVIYILAYKPDVIVLEDIFFHRNFKGFKMLAMYQACALLATQHVTMTIPVKVITSAQVHKANKIASKKREEIKLETCKKINRMFKTKFNPKDHSDIADAMSVCMAYITAPETAKFICQ